MLPAQGDDWSALFGCSRSSGSLVLTRRLLEVPLEEWTWDGVVQRLHSLAESPSVPSSARSTITAP